MGLLELQGTSCEEQLGLSANAKRSALAFNLSYLFRRARLLAEVTEQVGWLEKGAIVPDGTSKQAGRLHHNLDHGIVHLRFHRY